MRKITRAALLIMLASTPAMASAETSACMSAQQADAVWLTFLPTAIEAVAARCGPELPADAFLNRQGVATAARFRADAAADKTLVAGAIAVMLAGEDNVTAEMSPTVMTAFADEIVRGMVKSKVQSKDCRTTNDVMELVAPLPPRNFAKLLTLLMASDKTRAPFKVCPLAQNR